MTETRLLLIRHAHPDIGPAPGLLCGRHDAPLSVKGHDQVRDLRTRCARTAAADALYTSPLRRAAETAAALADAWRLTATLEPGIQEIDCGRLDGCPIVTVEREYPELWTRNSAQTDDDFRWPGGESYREFRSRVLAGLCRIASAHPSGRVAVVTHAGVISQVLGAVQGRPAAEWGPFRPRPCTASEVIWNGGAPVWVLSFDERDWH